jgi:hypothetical protein
VADAKAGRVPAGGQNRRDFNSVPVRSCVTSAPPDGIFATAHAGARKGAKTSVLSRYIGGCGAGPCYCAIQPNGDITPCVYISTLKVGSLRRQSLAEIWDCSLFGVNGGERRGHFGGASRGHAATAEWRRVAYQGASDSHRAPRRAGKKQTG